MDYLYSIFQVDLYFLCPLVTFLFLSAHVVVDNMSACQ